MATHRAQVVIHTADGIGANFVTNTWHCNDDGINGSGDFAAALVEFYRSMVLYYPNTIAIGPHEVKVYNLDDPLPRAPVLELPWSFATAPTGDPLPSEMAVCLSFQAEKESGVSQARRRGRVFLGPLDATTNTSGRPLVNMLTAIAAAAQVLLDESNAPGSWVWAIYSPTIAAGGGLASQAVSFVDNGWVDNAFDVQRRRGIDSNFRTTFASPA